MRGRSPRTREGRIGPTAQKRGERGEERVTPNGQGKVGSRADPLADCYLRNTRVRPHFGMHPLFRLLEVEKSDLLYQSSSRF